jgi:hypothetical protein
MLWFSSLFHWIGRGCRSSKDGCIANKAVKADNAFLVDFYPWNQRIMLVLPCTPKLIECVEILAMQRWRGTVSRSFRQYLTRRYGSDWENQWRSGLSRRDDETGGDMNECSAAGVKAPEVLGALGSTENKKGGGVGKATWGEKTTDFIKGRLVLHQVLQSKWWEWSHGSALLFWRWNAGSEQVTAARDGMRIYVQSPLPVGRKRMKKVKLSPEVRVLVAEKIEGMCNR